MVYICHSAFTDFDGDSFLNRIDLERTLRCLTRNELTEEEVSFVVEKVAKRKHHNLAPLNI